MRNVLVVEIDDNPVAVYGGFRLWQRYAEGDGSTRSKLVPKKPKEG